MHQILHQGILVAVRDLEKPGRDAEKWRQQLADAGFADLDSNSLASFLYFFAESLLDAPLESFEDVNRRIGTANGLASGWVRDCMRDLVTSGYLKRSRGGASLTSRGVDAARAVGITVD